MRPTSVVFREIQIKRENANFFLPIKLTSLFFHLVLNHIKRWSVWTQEEDGLSWTSRKRVCWTFNNRVPSRRDIKGSFIYFLKDCIPVFTLYILNYCSIIVVQKAVRINVCSLLNLEVLWMEVSKHGNIEKNTVNPHVPSPRLGATFWRLSIANTRRPFGSKPLFRL